MITRLPRVATILTALAMTGCMRWDVITTDPRSFVETEQPSHIRVTLADESTVEIRQPIVAAGTLIPPIAAITGRVTLERIESLEVRKVDATSSVGGVSLLLLALLLGAAAASPF